MNLLTWHGHAAGGVHVPFQGHANPLGEVIESNLVLRLRDLAASLAHGGNGPRWIFLVGGPGNGKSEAVQDFLTALDANLGMEGVLTRALTDRFTTGGLLPRRVEITGNDLSSWAERFSSIIGRLIIVQDATATDTAQGNAARELANDLTDLITSPADKTLPVFIACVNRGLLARAMNEAYREFGGGDSITQVLTYVIQASALGSDALSGRKSCWPLEIDHRFACWPLDVESLLEGSVQAPLDFMVTSASQGPHWEVLGRCSDCTSRDWCPMRQNAEWLRDGTTRRNLLLLLRRGELANGQKWNFRDALSLVAELLVGQWSDFEGYDHPCDWVHARRATATIAPPDPVSVVSLVLRLYSQALFNGGVLGEACTTYLQERELVTLTDQLLGAIANINKGASIKPIREALSRDYLRLDPATTTPSRIDNPLHGIEDAFCQSVELGHATMTQLGISWPEDQLFNLLEKAEQEWDVLSRDSAGAIVAVCVVRKVAAMLAKRSMGVRLGHHALDQFLSEYETLLRDTSKLTTVRAALQPLLGDAASKFNLLEVLGQPTAEDAPLVGLVGPPPGIRPVPAPAGTETSPGHDMPSIEVRELGYRIPLTFDFYMALRLRRDGCAGSSLPASVRAALDRVRHRYAGALCRAQDGFIDGLVSIELATHDKIGITNTNASPTLVRG